MSYLVLARKWRPRTFDEMVGQEHVLRALINALDNDRLHHAFLFTGTRGVGKTTIARILAKALNCEEGVSSRPCGKCGACVGIDEGRFVDLIEVDAASRTKVEDTRDLLDNVQYAPTRGRYKVYLIDEVHMLSKSSFNALLKTLEEPPPHVKFLLATTDPQKLPVTVLSRCLQFNLKRLPLALIEERLSTIAAAEKTPAEGAALTLLARAAAGSMRDGLSLLDQAIAYGGGTLTEADMREMLGTIAQEHVVHMLDALAAGDGPALMERVAALDEQAPDYFAVLDEMAALLQRVALLQVVPEAVDAESGDSAILSRLGEAIAPEDVQLYYQIALTGRRDLPLAPEPRSGFEMTLLRMLAFRPESGPAGPAGPAVAESAPVSRQAAKPAAKSASAGRPPLPPDGDAREATPWPGLVEALELHGAARQLAANCAMLRHEGLALHLQLDAPHAHLCTKQLQERLQQALRRHFGEEDMRLQIHVGTPHSETPAQRDARHAGERQTAAEAAIEGDPNIRALKDTFGATVSADSVQPVGGGKA